MEHDDAAGEIRWLGAVSARIESLPGDGPVLDFGGGGEGVIGRVEPARVIAVDRLREELLEAPPGPARCVMDGVSLGFRDAAFDGVTAFFSLMYVDDHALPLVLRELHRVLRPGAWLRVWDVELPALDDGRPVAIRVHVETPAGDVDTGYGVGGVRVARDLGVHRRLLIDAGFSPGKAASLGSGFHLVATKPRR